MVYQLQEESEVVDLGDLDSTYFRDHVDLLEGDDLDYVLVELLLFLVFDDYLVSD